MKNFITNLLLKIIFFINKENCPPEKFSRKQRQINKALIKSLFERNTFAYYTGPCRTDKSKIILINKVDIVPCTVVFSGVRITAQTLDGIVFDADSEWFTLFEECHVCPKQTQKLVKSLEEQVKQVA